MSGITNTLVIIALVVVIFVLGITITRIKSENEKIRQHADGEMVVVLDGGGVRTFSLEVNGDPEELAHKDVIVFRVRKTAVPVPPE